jgi:hypothetical protein
MMDRCFSIYFILENNNLDDNMVILVKPITDCCCTFPQGIYLIYGDKISTIHDI